MDRAMAWRWFVVAIGIAACGDDGTPAGGTADASSGSSSSTTDPSTSSTSTAGGSSTETGTSSSGALETSSDSGATTMLAPDMGVPIDEPSAEPCGSLDPHPPPNYHIYGDRYGAVWGFVVDDREYAALTNTFGLSIIDVTDDPLVEVAYLELPGYVPGRALAAHGNALYIGGQGPGGSLASLRIVDIADPFAPVLVTEYAEYTDQIHTLDVYDEVLYLNSGFGACRFFTLEDPFAPDAAGAYYGNDCHDVLAVGDRLYVAGGYAQRWDVVDITNLHAPAILGTTAPVAGIYAHSGVLDESGQYFLGIEEFHVEDMLVYDVSDPGNPTYVTSFSIGDDVVPHNAVRRGNYIYAAWYEAGFVLLDIHDPTAPFEALRVPTWPDPPLAELDGAIEIDLRLPSGKVMVSDSREGLFVLCVETPP